MLAHVGLIAGLLYAIGSSIYDVLTTGSVNLGTALAFIAPIGKPIIFAVIGYIVGLLEAYLYNMFTRWHS
jgi:hypothetical protein